MSTFYVPLIVILLLYWRIFMTARKRLRKRLAQKAKPLSSQISRQSERSQTQNSVTIHNNVASNNTACNSNQNVLIVATPTPSARSPTKLPLGGISENCSITLASTAVTIEPNSNQVQTVVVLPSREGEMSPEEVLVPSKEQGN